MSPSSWQAHSHLLLPWQWRHPASFVSAGRREVFFFCFALHNKCNAVDKGYCTTSAISSSQYLIDSNRLRSLSLKCLLTLQLGTWHTEINQFSKDTEEFLWHSQMLKVCFRLMFDYYIETITLPEVTGILPTLGQVSGSGSSSVPVNMPQPHLKGSDYCHHFAFLLRTIMGTAARDNSGDGGMFPPGKMKMVISHQLCGNHLLIKKTPNKQTRLNQ